MAKGQRTREHIVQQAAALFNQRGYVGASLSEVMAATGLQKGGIYNHFGSKDALAIEAFDYAVGRVVGNASRAIASQEHAADRLLAMIEAFGSPGGGPPLPGGCPIFNTAVEADDGHPLLRERARSALDHWLRTIRLLVLDGVRKGELRPETDPDEAATLIISALEGALVLTRLYDDPYYLDRARAHLREWIEARRLSPA